MDDYCHAKMATSDPPTSSKSPTEKKMKTEDEDVQQLIGHPEELLPLSGGSSIFMHEVSQHTHVKKEEEEIWITQEGECLLGPHEADLTKLPLTVVSVKTEDDEEKPQVDNLLAPLSDSEPEEEVEVTLSSDTDCEGITGTHTDDKRSWCSKKKRGAAQTPKHGTAGSYVNRCLVVPSGFGSVPKKYQIRCPIPFDKA
ncbi:uncharacterized protein LOC133632314 isoform X2 [Entelurus aequoreus]|uniref:uncharacterized protein LOC133632314 isoform X2 n=1 Tax=Entelurus aequoreus TaxID=161455 RepID=UPI002B1E057E|nr:uncharacterized protein LOC133632314 isoform X2 [Entelurus aequoreus]